MTRKWLRWLPAVAAPAVIAAAALTGSLPASAGNPLPAKTPGEVLALVAGHSAPSLSGTLEQSSNMGLPSLSKLGPSTGTDGTSILELLSGPHTARVFLDGSTHSRVQVLDRLAERNAVRNGDQIWLYSSKDNSATHLTLPAGAAQHQPARTEGAMPTPEELAARLLATAGPTTDFAVLPDVNVAGRPAYNLMLTPRGNGTLIGSVAIAVDGQSGLPLSVEVKARGQAEPALKVAFTSLSLQAPDAALFAFSPPPGATVKESTLKESAASDSHAGEPGSPAAATHERPSVTGSGWESVVETRLDATAAGAPGQPGAFLSGDPLLQQAAVAVPGGHLFSTAIVNVLLTDDGRIFAGSVPAEQLQAAAANR